MERFWSKVKKGENCWEWQASCQPSGYGQFVIRLGGKNVTKLTHRVAWELTHGPIQSGECVLHKCDNRKCVRPDHLFLGSKADNNTDMTAKGRRALGERFGHAKLTEREAKDIRRDQRTLVEIASQYRVSMATVSMIRNGRTWRHQL